MSDKENMTNIKDAVNLLINKLTDEKKIGCNKSTEDDLLTKLSKFINKLNSNGQCKEIENELTDKNGYYPSQIEFANDIFEAFKTNNIVIAKAPMQYGKTGMIHYLANALIGPTLEKPENVIFMTSMSDTALLTQNIASLNNKEFIDENGKKIDSKIVVVKMIPDFKNNAEEIIKEYNIKYLIFDECDYGSGDKSLFSQKFFNRLKNGHFNLKLLLVSATPYCALHAVYEGELDATIVEAKIPENYFGVSKMLQHNMITDINNMFDEEDEKLRIPYKVIDKDEDRFSLSEEFKHDLNWFQKQEGGGLAIIRARNTNDAHLITSLVTAHSNGFQVLVETIPNKFEAISIGVKSTPIKEILSEGNMFLKNRIINNDSKILLVVVNALSAGKDLGKLKKYVRLVIETRRAAIANGSQGLIGRVCGYHDNRNIKMIGSLDVLRNYSRLERDAEIMMNSDFINEAIELKLEFSTQLKKGKKGSIKTEYKQIIHDVFSKDDVINKTEKLINLFPKNDDSFGTWEELENIILKNQQTVGGSHINTQRRSKYVKNPDTFIKIFKSAVDGTLEFGTCFHRFRAEVKSNETKRLRITRGIIYDDENDKFFIIDRIDDGEKVSYNATVKNKSCYIN